MTQEEKWLVLKDLCARLPYGVKMKHKNSSDYEVLCQIDTFYTDVEGFHCLLRTTGPFGGFQDLNELKPYLRSMSSMTDKEWDDFNAYRGDGVMVPLASELDWLNEHHFDYNGLIVKGLAYEAPEDMYLSD